MGLKDLFSKKTAAEVVEKTAPVVENAAAAVKEGVAPVAEKAAEAVAHAAAAVEAKAAEAAEKAAVVKEEAAAAESSMDEVVSAAEEAAAPAEEEAAPAGEAAPAVCAQCAAPNAEEKRPELTKKEIGTVYHVRMNYHAGYGVYKQWPNGGRTIHSGIGWFHPFGPSEYYGVANIPGETCEESKQFPLEKFFTEDWMENFETDLFCIYRMPDGDIYAWDGMFAVRGLDENKCIVYNSEYTRQDVLVNVIVGGTGHYEGVRGLLIGTTEGGGGTKVVGEMPDGSPLELPETIMKDLDGYIRFPE